MKDMRKVLAISVLLVVISFSAVAQVIGSPRAEEQQAFGASAPSATFQSTSALPATGSTYSASPTLNEDGTAKYNGAANVGPRTPNRPGVIRTADPIIPDPSAKIPLGDALWPLMFLALAFAGYVALKRRHSSS